MQEGQKCKSYLCPGGGLGGWEGLTKSIALNQAHKDYKTHHVLEQFFFHHGLQIHKKRPSSCSLWHKMIFFPNSQRHSVHVPYVAVRPIRWKRWKSKLLTARKVSCGPYRCKWNPIFFTYFTSSLVICAIKIIEIYKMHMVWSRKRDRERDWNPLQHGEWEMEITPANINAK